MQPLAHATWRQDEIPMIAQIAETLRYKGRILHMASLPFEQLFDADDQGSDFVSMG